MLVEFRVGNFRSIRDEQVLSLVASSDKSLRDTHVHETGLKAVPGVLRSAAIYGANASGKSNVIKALKYMRDVVLQSATKVPPEQTYNVQSFRFDQGTKEDSTEFEITFLKEGVRHEYGFSMNQKRFLSEHLTVYKTAKPQHWFDRWYDESTENDVYEYKTGLTGPKQVWEEATRPNALFLSMASQLNSKKLRSIYEWFAESLVIFNEDDRLSPDYTVKEISDRNAGDEVSKFIAAADISVERIDVEPIKALSKAVFVDFETGKTEVRDEEQEQFAVHFYHKSDAGDATFEFMDESAGTRNLFTLAGPVLDILKRGKTLVIDELDTSLHPLIVHHLVKLFHNDETNQGNAQLIFSTHDTSLLDSAGLFRRDQIWFTNKGHDQATKLVGLSEYKPRKGEALERGYLSGRYGGIPFLDPNMKLRL